MRSGQHFERCGFWPAFEHVVVLGSVEHVVNSKQLVKRYECSSMSPSAFIPLYLHRLTCHQFAVHYLMVYVCVYVCAGVKVCVCVCTLWKTQTLCPCAHITCDGIHNPCVCVCVCTLRVMEYTIPRLPST